VPSTLESRVVNLAGLAQGIVLVTFPAASTIFTEPSEYALSSTQYGALFLPQVVTAITTSLLGSRMARRYDAKRVYLAGLASSLVAMALLLASAPTAGTAVAYPILLVATAFVGAGFGLTVPSLNTFTAAFHPDRVDRSVLVLNALLGLGTALAPVFVALFVGLGFWWGLPVLSAGVLVILLGVSSRLPLVIATPVEPIAGATSTRASARIPSRFWVFAGFAVLYGICETMNGNWAQSEMTEQVGASAAVASLGLTAFWGMVTVGRVGFASLQRRIPTYLTYRLLPFVLAVALGTIAVLPEGADIAGVLAFGLAGLGCSALLPLTISFGQEQLTSMTTAAAGGVIAFYQVGYGIAAFGSGPLQASGVTLSTLFGATAGVAIVMGLVAFIVTSARPQVPPIPSHPTEGAPT
jgi:MFS family permease